MTTRWHEYATLIVFSVLFSAAGPPPVPPRVFLICDPPPPGPCEGKPRCTTLSDEIDVAVDASGQITVNAEKVTKAKLKYYVANWAKTADYLPIVVIGEKGATYSQVASTVALVRQAGAKRVACWVPQR